MTLQLSLFAAETPHTLKVLLITGGCCHNYQVQAPYLTTNLSQLINATFTVKFGLDSLVEAKFADDFDAIFYNFCDEDATQPVIEHALMATRNGKPTVMMHCAIHALRNSPKVRDWETLCGMRSKVHDPYEPFTVLKLDASDPITKLFPDDWKTAGDELYQTISIEPESHQLLKAKSPKDGREHIVCWTREFGKGRVFATTLGHDMKTCSTLEYHRLLANGLLWACGKLQPDGTPAPGYAGSEAGR
jgi:type 1 glutamine amidotransferase